MDSQAIADRERDDEAIEESSEAREELSLAVCGFADRGLLQKASSLSAKPQAASHIGP